MNQGARRDRLLWNDRSAVAFCCLALAVTFGVILLQVHQRAGLFDPQSVDAFFRLFLFQDYPAAFVMLAVLLVALAPPIQRLAVAVAVALGRHPRITAVVACVLLACSSVWVYQVHPLSMDEYAAVLQSRIFATGHLYGQVPPALVDWLLAPGFQNYFIHVSHETGQIASSYWPGFALLLTPFTAAGVPWLCNPVLGALALLAVHRMTLELTGSEEAAGAAILLSFGSAAFVVNAFSFYSMTAHLLCNAVFALLLFRPTPGRAAAAGAVGGLALVLHNPVPHMLFAAPWLAWLLLRGDRRKTLPALIAGYLPWVLVAGFGWTIALKSLAGAGSAVAAPQPAGLVAYAARTLASVFHWPSADTLEVRLVGVAKLWLWAAPCALLLGAIGFWRHRADIRYRLLLSSAALMLLGYVFVPLSQGHGWGYRYFHPAWFVVPVFAASALASSRGGMQIVAAARPPAAWCYTMGAALVGVLALVPYFMWQVNSFISEHLAQLPTTDHGRARVVIVYPYIGYYAQDLVQNDPFLREPVIRMITRGGAKDQEMMAREFPVLQLLARSYRGTVWGKLDAPRADSGAVAVGPQDEHQQE